jgi:hypothetical protein
MAKIILKINKIKTKIVILHKFIDSWRMEKYYYPDFFNHQNGENIKNSDLFSFLLLGKVNGESVVVDDMIWTVSTLHLPHLLTALVSFIFSILFILFHHGKFLFHFLCFCFWGVMVFVFLLWG